MPRFTPCACGIQYLVRLDREPWMRWIPTRRHYFCAKCRQTQLLPRCAFASVSWWMPTAPSALDEPADATPAAMPGTQR
jgi:hypothetical protein